MRKKLKAIAEENIRNYHNRDKLLSKKYIKSLKNSKLTPNRKQKSADERFWEHVDKLWYFYRSVILQFIVIINVMQDNIFIKSYDERINTIDSFMDKSYEHLAPY